MKKRIAIFGSLMLAFLTMVGMTPVKAGPGCNCNAHGITDVPSAR